MNFVYPEGSFHINADQIRSLIIEAKESRCFSAGRNASVGKRCYRPKKHNGKHRYY